MQQSVSHTTWRHRGWNPALVFLIALSAFLRFYRIGNQSLWVDELLTIGQSGLGKPLSQLYILQNIHGPLESLIIHFLGFIGRSEALLRTPSALFGILGVVASYWVGKALWNDRLGLLTAFYVAISPLGVWYSQEVRNYSMCVFFATAAMVFLLRWFGNRAVGSLLAYGGAILLAFFSNLSSAFTAIVGQAISLLSSRKRVFWGLLALNVAVGILLLPWVFHAWGEWVGPRLQAAGAAPLRGETTFTPMAIPFAFYSFSVGFTLGPSLQELHLDRSFQTLRPYLPEIGATATVFGLIAFVGAITLFRRARTAFAVVTLWLFLPVGLVSLLALLNIKAFNPRYLLVSWPAYCVLLAAGSMGAKRFTSLLAVGSIVVLSAVSLRNHYFESSYWKEDARSAARFLREVSEPGSRIVAYSVVEPLRWYLPEMRVTEVFPAEVESADDARRKVAEVLDGAEVLWLVTSRDWAVDPDQKLLNAAKELFGPVEIRRFQGITVTKVNARNNESGNGL